MGNIIDIFIIKFPYSLDIIISLAPPLSKITPIDDGGSEFTNYKYHFIV
jgi:hypothetical protein